MLSKGRKVMSFTDKFCLCESGIQTQTCFKRAFFAHCERQRDVYIKHYVEGKNTLTFNVGEEIANDCKGLST